MINDTSVRLDLRSAFEVLEVVQVVSDCLGRGAGLDDAALHWVGLAVRESVINAIDHGNGNDETKRVFVEFTSIDGDNPGIAIRVRDQGSGFDPMTLLDPRTPENVLKSSGRGILLIRTFMDAMTLRRAAEGGMEMVIVKRVRPVE
jgi:serine/threonine-protein kinase RsbW